MEDDCCQPETREERKIAAALTHQAKRHSVRVSELLTYNSDQVELRRKLERMIEGVVAEYNKDGEPKDLIQYLASAYRDWEKLRAKSQGGTNGAA